MRKFLFQYSSSPKREIFCKKSPSFLQKAKNIEEKTFTNIQSYDIIEIFERYLPGQSPVFRGSQVGRQ